MWDNGTEGAGGNRSSTLRGNRTGRNTLPSGEAENGGMEERPEARNELELQKSGPECDKSGRSTDLEGGRSGYVTLPAK